VRKVEDDFTSHAWIECDGRILLGGGVEHLYATLPAPAIRYNGAQQPSSRASSKNLGNEGSDVLR
jgi:hypothetical protein